METFNTNNIVKIGGIIVSDLEFSHEIYDEKFYKFFIEVDRLSELKDTLPIIVSERTMNIETIKKDLSIFIEGQFRSYNDVNENGSKLILSIFAKEIKICEIEEVSKLNEINLEGYICKKPIYRKTPLGREISDILLAVNRTYKKSDYIPCILWGRNAKYSENIETGIKVRISGRIQARGYDKKQLDGSIVKHTAYEVSVSKFGICEESNNIEE
ncbi:MAG: single-stranded DNA-binding protein [Clostridia bacterium]